MATRTISNGGGNWDSVGTWVEGIVPIAGDAVVATGTSGNLTVNVPSACASFIMTNYVNTLTFNSTLTLTSTCTFVAGMTIAGTAGTLILGGTATLTSAGKTLTCALTFAANVVWTLADNWTVNGLVTVNSAGSPQVDGAGKTVTCAGGLHVTTGNLTGSAKFALTGGTWDQAAGTAQVNLDLAGNVTVSGAVTWGGSSKTLKYLSGTIITTGSTLTLQTGSPTLDTAGMTWTNVTFPNTLTYAVASTLAWSGTLSLTGGSVTFSGAGALSGTGAVAVTSGTVTLNNTGGLVTTGTMTLPTSSIIFAGTAGFTVGTLTNTAYVTSRTVTLTFGNTYTVTAALTNVGTTAAIRQAMISSSAGNKVVFNLTPGASCNLRYCDPTDVNSLGGATVLSLDGVITNTDNWIGSYVTPTAGTGGSVKVVRPKSRMRM